MSKLQLPFSNEFADQLIANADSIVGDFFQSYADLAELLSRREELKPGNGFAEWVEQQNAAFVQEGAANLGLSPIELGGFPLGPVVDITEQMAEQLSDDDEDREVLTKMGAACRAIGTWGPEVDTVDVDAAERPVQIQLMGAPDDVATVKAELAGASTLDEVAEIGARHQKELAESCGWPHTDTTPCCSRGGYVAPQETVDKLGPLAIAHDFERPSDEEPQGMSLEDVLRMLGGGGPAPEEG